MDSRFLEFWGNYMLAAAKGQQQIDDLYKLLKISNLNQLKNKIYNTVQKQIPFSLHQYGIKKDDLNWLVKHCFSKERMDNHIITLSEEDVLLILNEMY